MKQPTPVFAATVDKSGKLQVSATQKQAMARWCRTLKGHEVEVIVRKKPHKRSLNANAYFHAVPVELMAEEWGVSHDEAYYLLLGEWRGYKDGPLGRMPNCMSGSKLTKEEFSELITWVLDYGPSEWNVYIPPPESVLTGHAA